MSRLRKGQHESDLQESAEKAVAEFAHTRMRLKLTDKEDLDGAAIFVVYERFPDNTSEAQDSRSRRLRNRRQIKKRARDFEIFLMHYGDAVKSGEISSQDDAVKYIIDNSSRETLLDVRRVYSADEIISYYLHCFRNGGCNGQEWLGHYDTWLLECLPET